MLHLFARTQTKTAVIDVLLPTGIKHWSDKVHGTLLNAAALLGLSGPPSVSSTHVPTLPQHAEQLCSVTLLQTICITTYCQRKQTNKETSKTKQNKTKQYNTIQYNTIQYNTIQYNTTHDVTRNITR
jgi:cyanate permease